MPGPSCRRVEGGPKQEGLRVGVAQEREEGGRGALLPTTGPGGLPLSSQARSFLTAALPSLSCRGSPSAPAPLPLADLITYPRPLPCFLVAGAVSSAWSPLPRLPTSLRPSSRAGSQGLPGHLCESAPALGLPSPPPAQERLPSVHWRVCPVPCRVLRPCLHTGGAPILRCIVCREKGPRV